MGHKPRAKIASLVDLRAPPPDPPPTPTRPPAPLLTAGKVLLVEGVLLAVQTASRADAVLLSGARRLVAQLVQVRHHVPSVEVPGRRYCGDTTSNHTTERTDGAMEELSRELASSREQVTSYRGQIAPLMEQACARDKLHRRVRWSTEREI